jgi:hypothetical protein
MAAPFAYAPDDAHDYGRIIHGVRLELEAAGNPAYLVVLVDAADVTQLSHMVFATVHSAADLARRLGREAPEGTEALIVSRQADRRRAQYSVLDPATLRKRHEQLEVIEPTFAEIDGPL